MDPDTPKISAWLIIGILVAAIILVLLIKPPSKPVKPLVTHRKEYRDSIRIAERVREKERLFHATILARIRSQQYALQDSIQVLNARLQKIENEKTIIPATVRRMPVSALQEYFTDHYPN
jgi:hypothetical protein